MTPAARRSLVAAFAVLSVIGLLRSCATTSEFRPDTRSTAPWGYGAFFELCQRLWPGTDRVRATDVAPEAAVWWLPPAAACHPRPVAAAAPWALGDWTRAGGTAIVPLPGAGERHCEIGSDVSIPARTRRPIHTGAALKGPGARRQPRRLETPPRAFARVGDEWRTVIRAGGRPFVIERPVGAGRLVLVADASFLTNEHLARGDAAPLAAALAARWAPPLFHDAAPRGAPGPLAYLARSAGAVPLVALAALGLLVAWHGAAVPPRASSAEPAPAPQLNDLVRSLARLLGRSRDHDGVLASQRAWALAVLAPRLGVPPHASSDVVVDRVRTVLGPAGARALEDASPVRDAHDLERRLAALTAVVEEVVA